MRALGLIVLALCAAGAIDACQNSAEARETFTRSIRCGQSVISAGDSVSRVLTKCGRPDREVRLNSDVETPTEVWYYLGNRQRFTRVVYIQGNRVNRLANES